MRALRAHDCAAHNTRKGDPLMPLSFETPHLLMTLALLPVLALLYVLAQRQRRKYAVQFTNLRLLSKVVKRAPGAGRHVPPLFYLFGIGALLLAFARPSAVLAVPRDQSVTMLVLDVSASMSADDLKPNRFEASKQAAREFLRAMPADAQVGIVTFSSTAGVLAAPTRDRELLTNAVNNLSLGGGTAIGEGLNVALDSLQNRPVTEQGRVPARVIVLSDGENALGRDPVEAAVRAAGDDVRVFTIGIGQRGSQVRIGDQVVGLDEDTLRDMAARADGEYYYAQEAGALSQIYANLGRQVTYINEEIEITSYVAAAGLGLLLLGGLAALRWFQRFP
jgi:Ca-activated chloride channel homolog